MINSVFFAQCTTVESALRALPYVTFVDALPFQSDPNQTTIVVDFDETRLTMSTVCEILGIISTHLGDQDSFELEIGRATMCVSAIKFRPEVAASHFIVGQ
jgi:hypothetical protein